MSDLKRFQELVKWFEELVFGTEPKPKQSATMKSRKKVQDWIEEQKKKPKKRKRARKKDGTFKGDDKSTPDVNEAWENE